MKLIFAQGNPGPDYEKTRHNVGFRVLDAMAIKYAVPFVSKSKFFADVAELTISGNKVMLVKPTTFYNETGKSARAIIDFYKLHAASDVLVVHDDLALPLGTIRTRDKGSDAGNNGIKSLNAHIGSSYARLRIGINNDLRGRIPDADFVLSRFTKSEEADLSRNLIPTATDIIDTFITDSFQSTTHS